ncbi:unnamed protein product [Lepidochelys olivacea]
MPILDQMVAEQNMEGVKWTPSKMIAQLGKEINNSESVYYWAQKNNIPVLSLALMDGFLGDMIFFHRSLYVYISSSYKKYCLPLTFKVILLQTLGHPCYKPRPIV